MAFKYGAQGQPIEIPDAGNPLTLYHLGRMMAFIEALAASEEMPATMKATADKLVQDGRHHVSLLAEKSPGAT